MRMANSIEQANVTEDSLIRTHLVYCHGGPRDWHNCRDY